MRIEFSSELSDVPEFAQTLERMKAAILGMGVSGAELEDELTRYPHVPVEVLYGDPEPVIMGLVFCGFGKAYPYYVENDPVLFGRSSVPTTGRVLQVDLA